MSNTYFGIIMILIGLFFFISGLLRSQFFIYRRLVAKSEKMWGKNVHLFYQISGVLLIISGIILAIGMF